jgi:hypothetical protein
MLGRRQVVAVENANAIARQPRCTPRFQFVNHQRRTFSRIAHHGLRNSQFHALEFVVDRVIAHRKLVPTFAVRSEHRWFHAQYHRLHQLDHRRKKQFSFILSDRCPSKQIVEMFRFEESLDDGSRHDSDGSLLNKGGESSCKHPCRPLRKSVNPVRTYYSGAAASPRKPCPEGVKKG